MMIGGRPPPTASGYSQESAEGQSQRQTPGLTGETGCERAGSFLENWVAVQ